MTEEHPESPRADTAIRVLRVLKTPLTLLALALLLFGGFRLGYSWLTAPPPEPTVAPCIEHDIEDGQLQAEQVSVRIFNAGAQRGLAGNVGRALREDDFNIVVTANYEGDPDDVPEGTMIIGADPENPEVQLVAGHFDEPELVGDGRIDRSVEIRLGEAPADMNDDAANALDYDEATICLPEVIESTQ